MERQRVFEILSGERDYQDRKWNASTTETAGLHSIEEFIMYIEYQLDIAKKILSSEARQTADPKAMDILRKATALGVSCMEQHGVPARGELYTGKQEGGVKTDEI